MTIAAILSHKGTVVFTVGPAASIAEVAALLTQKGIGAVPVVDGGQLLGIVSERDIVRSLDAVGAPTLEMTAGQLMTRALQHATPKTTIIEAMRQMTAGRFRHVPVMENGQLIGLVSIGDVVKARIMEQEEEVDSLKSYIASA
ncbi:MAG: CBS domain-containing protein [Acetobacteraceae bacterium]